MHVSPDGIADNVAARNGAGAVLRDRGARSRPRIRPARTGITLIATARRTCRSRAAWPARSFSTATSTSVPQIASAQERVLILQQLAFDALGTCESFDTVWPMQAARLFTVNGQLRPTITMRPGEVQRWRVIHAGFHDYDAASGWTATRCTRSPPTASRLPRVRTQQQHPGGARTSHRRAGQGRSAGHLCAAQPAIQPGRRPEPDLGAGRRGRGRRADGDGIADDASAAAARAHPHRRNHRHEADHLPDPGSPRRAATTSASSAS